MSPRRETRLLSDCLACVDTDQGRKRVSAYLASGPNPHFEPVPGRPGFLVRIDVDGTRRVGRFVKREFKPDYP